MRIALILLAACGMAASAGRAEPASHKTSPPSLDDLLSLYQEFGMPLPPPDAQLVRVPTGWFDTDPYGKLSPGFTLGFLSKSSGGTKPNDLLVGPLRSTRTLPPEYLPLKPVKPADVIVRKYSYEAPGATFPLDTTLATAIQCHARGDEKLAQALCEKAMTVRSFSGPCAVSSDGEWMSHRKALDFHGETGDDGKTLLAGTAWTYWMNELERADSDWNTAAVMMRKILAAAPALNDAPRRNLLHMLDAALVPSKAKPGGVEADIDALVQCQLATGGLAINEKPDARYQKLLLRGFKAVPALINHLSDQRLSHSVVVGFNNFPTMPRSVGEIAADLVQAISGEELSRDWLRRQLGKGVDKQTAIAWWQKAKVIGEESYVRSHVLPAGKDIQSPLAAHLAIIVARYPKYLPGIYEEILAKRPDLESSGVTVAISRSALPREEKIALLSRGVAHRSLKHQRPAIDQLREFDASAADADVIKMLKKLPRKTRGEVCSSDESDVSQLVMESSSQEVWDALYAAASRAHVSLRMELMNPMDYLYIGKRQRSQRLRFLARFLGDETIRVMKDDEKLYGGPCAAFTFPQISVRNFAALKIASILKLPAKPDKDWTPKQWADLHDKVAKASERQLR